MSAGWATQQGTDGLLPADHCLRWLEGLPACAARRHTTAQAQALLALDQIASRLAWLFEADMARRGCL